MRIVSGIHKGRKINVPKKLPVRPTTDMAKEALFNILRHRIDVHGATVLELYAGSGNMSYEFASRGALHITAVDRHRPCVAFIEKTANQLDLPITTITSDAISHLTRERTTYNLIFADPPYALETADFIKIADLVIEKNILQLNGVLIIEHSKHTRLTSHPACVEERKYGGTVFSFFENTRQEEE